MSSKVLLVEDEEHLREVIKLNLEMEGYVVQEASSGKKALDIFYKERFDIIILDIMLPEIDGFDICETIRLENKHVPVLFLTAKGNSDDRVRGLKIGGDDYLVKPFNLEEFLLRVKNLLKRSEVEEKGVSENYKFGKNSIHFDSYEIIGLNCGKKQLSKREARLLKLLIDRENEVVSREDILDKVWGFDVYPSTRTIDNYILMFRKYFEEDPKFPRYFHSVRGVGYKFTS